MTESKFDLVVLGASGFTGRLVAEYLYGTYGTDVRWAFAGRNQSKLEQIRAEICGEDAEQFPVLIADSHDREALDALVAQTKVVCTTVGPYARYGSELVAACAEAGVHYCDLTGEVQWMRKMIDQHHHQAEESGARIVHTCGFDSIPSDLGVYFLQQQMKEKFDCYAQEVKYRVGSTSGGVSGGTVESMMNMMDEAKTDRSLFDLLADPYSLNPANMPRGKDLNDAMSAEYDRDFKQWTAPFVMAGINTRVVRRSHALSGYPYGEDFRYSEAMLMGNGPGGFAKASMVSGGTGIMMLAAAFSPSRSLLRNLAPSPGEGPSAEARENGFFNIDLMGINGENRLCLRVTGDRDPGYGSTAKMLAESAVCLANDELPGNGGVLTPAVAMGDLLVNRLQEKAGVTFTVQG